MPRHAWNKSPVLTNSRVSELPAHHISIIDVPVVVTDCAPVLATAHLHSSLAGHTLSIGKSHRTSIASCMNTKDRCLHTCTHFLSIYCTNVLHCLLQHHSLIKLYSISSAGPKLLFVKVHTFHTPDSSIVVMTTAQLHGEEAIVETIQESLFLSETEHEIEPDVSGSLTKRGVV